MKSNKGNRHNDDIEARAERDRERVQRAAERSTKESQQKPKPDAGPNVNLTRGDTIQPESIEWLWPDWLARGKLSLLVGAPGTGKSTIAFALAAAVTSQGKWPDETPAPLGDVVIWSGEDDPADTIIPRLLADGADTRRVHIVTDTEARGGARPFCPASDIDGLRRAMEQIGDVHLLIVDPVVALVSADSHKNTEVRRALQPLVDLGAALKCVVLGISHFSKGGSGRDPVERVSGSIAFGALPRSVLVTARTEQECRVLARAKSSNGPDGGGFEYTIEMVEVPGYTEITASRISWGRAVIGTARHLIDAAEEPVPRRSAEAESWLSDLLCDGPLASTIVEERAQQMGFSAKTLRRAKEALGVTAKRVGGMASKGSWTCHLPERREPEP